MIKFFNRLMSLLMNQRGQLNAGGGGDPSPQQVLADLGDWRGYVPDDIKADKDLWSIAEKMQEKDFPSFMKTALHAQRRLGNAISLPAKDAKAEDLAKWKQDTFGKLSAAGLVQLEAAPVSPEGYQIAKPDGLPDGVQWSDEVLGEFKKLAHGLGLNSKQVTALVDFDAKRMEAMSAGLKTSTEQVTTALKEKWGDKYDQNYELGKRAAKTIFTDQETVDFFDKTGLGNHPLLLNALFEIGARMQESDGHIPGGQQPTEAGKNAATEMNDIIRNPQNAKHKLYWDGDRATMDYVDALRDKAYPGSTEL